MIFISDTHKIVMAPIFHLDKNPGGKKSSFLVMMRSEKEINEVVKETKCFSLVVTKGLMNFVKKESTIS